MAHVRSMALQGATARSVAGQIGMLGALVVVVTVLTFLFNLVGTLCICVVTGMMAGASRRFNWQVIGASLIPPAVAVGLGCVTKSELDFRRYVSLSGVCLGAFWFTWLATYLLLLLEKTNAQTSAQRTSTRSTASQRCDNPPFGGSKPEDVLRTGELEALLNLGHLQGTWHCDEHHSDDMSDKKLLIVTQDRFYLSIVNASGQARLLGQGDVTVCGSPGKTTLEISVTSLSKESAN